MTTELATGLMEIRLFSEIRQQAGIGYSPRIYYYPIPTGDRQWVGLHVPCATGTEVDVGQHLSELVADLCERGWTEDE